MTFSAWHTTGAISPLVELSLQIGPLRLSGATVDRDAGDGSPAFVADCAGADVASGATITWMPRASSEKIVCSLMHPR